MSRPYSLVFSIACLLTSSAALAFETVDTMVYPSSGRFPAYPAEAVRPYGAYIQGGLMHDTNVLRSNTNAENENIFRFGAGGFLEQRVVGRQRVRLNANADVYVFDKFSDLNHLAYAGGGTWLWEAGNELSGTLGYGRTHRLASLTEVQRAIKRTVTTDDFFGTAAYALGPNVRLRALGLYARGVRKAPGEETGAFGGRTVTFGVDYVTPLANAIGIEHRRSHGDAPVSPTVDTSGQFIGNDYKETETALVTTYTSSATLRFTGRIGRTERTYSDLQTGFKGTTYRAGAEWLPGVKTILGVEVYREPRGIIDLGASHVLIRGIAFGPAWAPTAKLAFSLRMVNEHRSFVSADANVAPEGTLLDETVRLFRFGIAWEPERLFHVGLGLDRGNRESNTLGRNYNYTATMINARLIW